jgi:hypothetical protein
VKEKEMEGATIDCMLALRSGEVRRRGHGSSWSGTGQGGRHACGHIAEDVEQHGQADGWAHMPRWLWHADWLRHGHVGPEVGNSQVHGLRPSWHVAKRVGCELARVKDRLGKPETGGVNGSR